MAHGETLLLGGISCAILCVVALGSSREWCVVKALRTGSGCPLHVRSSYSHRRSDRVACRGVVALVAVGNAVAHSSAQTLLLKPSPATAIREYAAVGRGIGRQQRRSGADLEVQQRLQSTRDIHSKQIDRIGNIPKTSDLHEAQPIDKVKNAKPNRKSEMAPLSVLQKAGSERRSLAAQVVGALTGQTSSGVASTLTAAKVQKWHNKSDAGRRVAVPRPSEHLDGLVVSIRIRASAQPRRRSFSQGCVSA